MQGEIDKTDGHFSIDYEDGRFRAVQFNPEKREEGSFIAEESISIEDLIKKCREKGLKHLESLSGPAVNVILEWMRARPALDYVGELWGGDSNLTEKGPMGPIGF